jgi:hypothetical protein
MRFSYQTQSTTARSQRGLGRGHETMTNNEITNNETARPQRGLGTRHKEHGGKGSRLTSDPQKMLFVYAKKLCASATR